MTASLPHDVLDAVRAALGGQYEIERTLGSGAMGSVLLGRDRTLERHVAIKVINPELATSATFRQRFLQEARTIANLRHGSIVAVHAAGDAGGVLYFVMEYVPGESLRDLLDREKSVSPDRTMAILRDLADALGYAHRGGVVHRDIKPENILVDRDTGRAKLTDFGISRSLAIAGGERMTGTGMLVGTPAYMSPEQAAGERELDGRSDLYSLGLVGYEMVAGQPAFTGKTATSVIMKQITEPAPPLVERAPAVSPGLAAVIDRALAKDPDSRWPDGEAMARALDAAATGAKVAGLEQDRAAEIRAAVAAAESKGRKRRVIAVLAVLLVMLPALWFVFRGRGGAPRGVDPRKSILVVPFHVLGSDPSLTWLRDGSVSMLSLNLAQWQDLQVVDHERILDLVRDAELEGKRVGHEDAIRMARRAGVWTVVTGEVSKPVADSIVVTASAFDVATGNRVGEPARAAVGAADDPRRLFDALSRTLLGLAGAPQAQFTEIAKTTTGSVEAYRDYLAGVGALNAWRLNAADSAFARALAADSTFALAWYKRSLARGWRVAADTLTAYYARMASVHAARLPLRERTLVLGNLDQQQRNFEGAQKRYAELLQHDSTGAEVWYGLADAYYHDNRPQGRAERMTRALAAFNRTLALDSTFHLAYAHKIDAYRQGALPQSGTIIERDTVITLDSAAVARLGRPRIEAARRQAGELAIRNAQQWVFTDAEAAQAYWQLAESYAAVGNYAQAVATLRQAMSRPATRQADFLYRIASYQLGAGSPEALATLRQALREQTADSLRASAGAQRFPTLLATANVALHYGSLGDFERVIQRVAEVEPVLPGTQVSGQPIETSGYLRPMRLSITHALGTPDPTLRRSMDTTLARIEAMPDGPSAEMARREMSGLVISAFIATRDTAYLATYRRWTGQEIPGVVLAMAALNAGDTTTAQRLASQFRRPDTTRLTVPQGPTSGLGEAEVLARLGDYRGALAFYEAMRPEALPPVNFDPRWGLFVRSLFERGEVYERVGERARADSAYSRFVELWKNADPRLQPMVQSARDRLRALRDAPGQGVPIKRP